jgi:hypothetical protein
MTVTSLRPTQAHPGAAARGPDAVRARLHAVAVWLHSHALSIVVLSALLIVGVVVHTSGMLTYPMRFDDEGTYVSQAWSVLARGELSPYTYWYDHPPFGWLQLAGYLSVTGALERAATTVAAGREAMLLAYLVSSVLLYVLARRLGFARLWAAVAVVLFTFSPLALYFHRMVLLDNIVTPWLLGAFVLALSPNRRLSAYAGSALCFAAAVLTKATTLLLLPALVYQVWHNSDRANRHYAWALFGSVLVLTGLLYPVYALLNGELFPSPDRVSLVEATSYQLGRDAAFTQRTIADWLFLDRYLLLFGALAAVPAVAVRRLRPYALMAAIHLAVVLRPGYLPVPYAAALVVPASLLIAGVLDALWKARLQPGKLRLAPPLLSVVAAAALTVTVWAHWSPRLQSAATYDEDAPQRQAEEWIYANVDREARLLVDNAIWLDLVAAGYPEENVVWFYKLDLDPVGVGVDFREGFRAFDYIVTNRTVRDSAEELPEIGAALDTSAVVAVFGDHNVVEVRKIHPDGLRGELVSDRQFVVDHYQKLLGREPNVEELAHFLTALQDGATHEDVVQALADSEEHWGENGGDG